MNTGRGPSKPQGPAGQSSRLQPRAPVGQADLAAAEEDPAIRAAGERLRRMMEDQVLMIRLAANNFEGKEWLAFEDVLIDYGNGVMMGWTTTGLVFTKLSEKKWAQLHPPAEGLTRAEIVDLVQETLGNAIPHFRTVLRQGKWRPEKGANLTTFFIGQCLWRFPNVYQRWLGQRHRQAQEDLAGAPAETLQGQSFRNPQDQVMTRIEIQEALDIDDPVTQRIVALKALEYTDPEIAESLGLSLALVRTRVHRYRRRTSSSAT